LKFRETELPIQIEGTFWFPEDPESMFHGKLIIGGGHLFDLKVQVPEDFLNRERFSEARFFDRKMFTILGQDEKARPLSLMGCGCTESELHSRGLRSRAKPKGVDLKKVSFFVNAVIRGSHVEDIESARFRSFSAFFTSFNQWAGSSRRALEVDVTSAVDFHLRDDTIENYGRFGIQCRGGHQTRFGDVDQSVLTRYWRPSFEPEQAASYDGVLGAIRSFQCLLSLFAGGPVGWDDLSAQLNYTVCPGNAHATLAREVELIVMMSGYKSSFEQLSDFHVLLREVEDEWPKIMGAWTGFYQRMYDVLNLYFAVVFGEGLLDQHKFLFLAQAIEGYHRAQPDSRDKRFSAKEFKKRKETVLKLIPADQIDWVSEALEYPPGTPFVDRLLEVIKSLKVDTSNFIQDLPEFCETVKNARNYLTHPGGGAKKEFAFSALWRQIRTTLELCFLRDIGIQEELISRVARRHPFRR
jgi:hypothetical protein